MDEDVTLKCPCGNTISSPVIFCSTECEEKYGDDLEY
jgi:hypothetical protein